MRHLEDALQASIKAYLDQALPADAFYYAVPNGGKRNAREAARMKGMGVRAGVPDLAFVYRGHAYFIELKTTKGRLTDVQKSVMGDIAVAGANVAVCRSLAAVEHQLRQWKFPLKATVMA